MWPRMSSRWICRRWRRFSAACPTRRPRAVIAADIEGALRTIMFTDLVGSTEMTARLGDVQGVEMVRAHDALVRRALKDRRGREVKHTGDGIMASFDDVDGAIEAARTIQQSFAAFNLASRHPLQRPPRARCRRALADSNDLFGSTVQWRRASARRRNRTASSSLKRSRAAAGTLGPVLHRRARAQRLPAKD